MKGDLMDNRIIVWNVEDARKLFESGYYGKPIGMSKPKPGEIDVPLILDLIEGTYLLECKKIAVYTDRRKVTAGQMAEICRKEYHDFNKKYPVYKKFRDMGYVVNPGIKFGCDFTVYEKGPGIDQTPYLVQVCGRSEPITAARIRLTSWLTTNVRKQFIFATPGKSGVDLLAMEYMTRRHLQEPQRPSSTQSPLAAAPVHAPQRVHTAQSPKHSSYTTTHLLNKSTSDKSCMVDGYCVKCKVKREVKNPKQIEMKNGRPAVKGECSKCGTKVFKIGMMEIDGQSKPKRPSSKPKPRSLKPKQTTPKPKQPTSKPKPKSQFSSIQDDESEQDHVAKAYAGKSKAEMAEGIIYDDKHGLKYVNVQGKRIKRSNKNIGRLKAICDYKCEICGITILKKDGGFYIEAAHIISVEDGGTENADNLLILCPNHHKEFDFGKRTKPKIISNRVKFRLSGKSYNININPSERGFVD